MAQSEEIGYEALHRNGPYTIKQLKTEIGKPHPPRKTFGKSEVKLSLALFTDCHPYMDRLYRTMEEAKAPWFPSSKGSTGLFY